MTSKNRWLSCDADSCGDKLVAQMLSVQHPQPLWNHFQVRGKCMRHLGRRQPVSKQSWCNADWLKPVGENVQVITN